MTSRTRESGVNGCGDKVGSDDNSDDNGDSKLMAMMTVTMISVMRKRGPLSKWWNWFNRYQRSTITVYFHAPLRTHMRTHTP